MLKSIRWLATIVVLTLGFTATAAVPANAADIWYQIQFRHNNKCLDLRHNNPGGEGVAGVVQQWTCAGRTSTNRGHQLWAFDFGSEGTSARIRKYGTNKCLSGNWGDGGDVYLWDCDTSAVWTGKRRHQGNPDYYHLMFGTASNLCLDMPNSSWWDGEIPQMWTCNNLAGNQHLTWFP
ncbi:RICIN domain-containing protein [Micromonospora sp. CPCC 205371]|nr:RICIN domain-containing protein [Micromonospora sp. CPCC 205371]